MPQVLRWGPTTAVTVHGRKSDDFQLRTAPAFNHKEHLEKLREQGVLFLSTGSVETITAVSLFTTPEALREVADKLDIAFAENEGLQVNASPSNEIATVLLIRPFISHTSETSPPAPPASEP